MNLEVDLLCRERCKDIGLHSTFPSSLDTVVRRTVAVSLIRASHDKVSELLGVYRSRLLKNAFPLMPNVVDHAELQKFEPQPAPESWTGKFILTTELAGEEKVKITIPRTNLTRTQLFGLVLEPREFPIAFEEVGHIVHYNFFNAAQLAYKHFIGLATLGKTTRTVVLKTNGIENCFRTLDFELIAGVPEYKTVVRQHGLTYHLDYSTVYWNSRLDEEHERLVARISSNLATGTFVLDGTCGVGPFAVPLGRANVCVVANDLNAQSYHYLCHNVAANRVEHNVVCRNKNCVELLKYYLLRPNTQVFPGRGELHLGAVILNLPELSIEFLNIYQSFDANQDLYTPMFYIEAFTRSEALYREDIIIRICVQRIGHQLVIARNIFGLVVDDSTLANSQDRGCDSFDEEFLEKNKEKAAEMAKQLFTRCVVRLVRDVGTRKYMVCVELAFNEEFIRGELRQLDGKRDLR